MTEKINNLRIESVGEGKLRLVAPNGEVVISEKSGWDAEYLRMVAKSNVDYLEQIQLTVLDRNAEQVIERELARIGASFEDLYISSPLPNENRLCINVTGDWKHDHGYMDHIMTTRFNLTYAGNYVTEDTECDWYSATHTYCLLR